MLRGCAIHLLMWMFVQPVLAQSNSWTKATSGYWEEPFWSLGALPSSTQSVQFTNAGYKALAISIATVNAARSSLTLSNLVVASPEGSFNTLLLNYSGLQNPLRVLNNFYLGTNSQLVNLSGSLHVEGTNHGAFSVDGTVIQAEGGEISFGDAAFGVSGSAAFTMTNGSLIGQSMLLGKNYPVTFQQLGGTASVTSVQLHNSGAIIDVQGGFFEAGFLSIGYTADFPYSGGGGGSFFQRGGNVMADGIGLGSFASGYYTLYSGTLTAGSIQLSGREGTGSFYQGGGTNNCGSLGVGDGPNSSGYYYLTNGMLVSQGVGIGGSSVHSGGMFSQYGGVHKTGAIRISGAYDDYSGIGSGGYQLSSGTVSSTNLSIGIFSGFSQAGGTNLINGDMSLEGTGGYSMTGGLLVVSNVVTSARYFSGAGRYGATLTQTGGTARVVGALQIIDISKYNLLAGNLEAPVIALADSLFLFGGGQVLSNMSILLGGPSRLQMAAPSLNLGKLAISEGPSFYYPTNNPTVDFGTNISTLLRFAASRDVPWGDGATLYVENWSGSVNGGGANRLLIGTNQSGLSARQLAQVVFINPAGFAAGNYPARILANGEIIPTQQPALAFISNPGNVKLIWATPFVLQTATNLVPPGLWADVANARSPWTNLFLNEPRRFFRLRR